MIVIIAFLLAGTTYAEKPDLTDAVLMHYGICYMQSDWIPCEIYEKQGVQYMVIRDDDQTRIVLIFRVRSGATIPYGATDFELLWSEDEEAKMQA